MNKTQIWLWALDDDTKSVVDVRAETAVAVVLVGKNALKTR